MMEIEGDSDGGEEDDDYGDEDNWFFIIIINLGKRINLFVNLRKK